MAGVVVKGRFPRRRIVFIVARNAFRYLFKGALRSWARNLGTSAPALGSMTLLLMLVGLVGVAGFALTNLAQQQAREASLLHVYLADDAAPADVDGLMLGLRDDPRVVSVTYVSKEEALARAQKRPGLPDLADATESNPFPASLDVRVKRIEDMAGVDQSVRFIDGVDASYPTSYDPYTYQRIQQLLLGLAVAGAAFLTLLGFVAVSVTSNSIRAAIAARRDEVSIMQLVGAPRWMVRGPFVIEGALTGSLAGALAGLITLGLGLGAIAAGAGSYAQVAPGVSVQVAVGAGALVFLVGLLLGSGSSLVGLRRHLEA
ncbi:MAG TPA: permease-like cell division protein FtsX [Candidatus Acidoferrales bacterium]|nr:permease-like cell division protein FtsX [Candidatus Acidoferrales bacterium]